MIDFYAVLVALGTASLLLWAGPALWSAPAVLLAQMVVLVDALTMGIVTLHQAQLAAPIIGDAPAVGGAVVLCAVWASAGGYLVGLLGRSAGWATQA